MIIKTSKMLNREVMPTSYADDVVASLISMHRGGASKIQWDNLNTSYTPDGFARNANGSLKVDDLALYNLATPINTAGLFTGEILSAVAVLKKDTAAAIVQAVIGRDGINSQSGMFLNVKESTSRHLITDDAGSFTRFTANETPAVPVGDSSTYILAFLYNGTIGTSSKIASVVYNLDTDSAVHISGSETVTDNISGNVGFGTGIKFVGVSELYGAIAFKHASSLVFSTWQNDVIAMGKSIKARFA